MNKEVLEAKKEVVNEIVNKAQNNKTLIVVEYRGLSVSQLQELRRALRAENASMFVYKNSLVTRAVDQLGYTELNSLLTGPNAFIFSEDEIKGAKVVSKYAKKYGETLNVKGGVMEGQFVDSVTLMQLAKLPGKEGLVSMFLSCLQAPIRQFACAVQAIADK